MWRPLTETVETVSNDQGVLEERILNSESRVSELEHTVDGLSVTMQEQYIGGINYVQNSLRAERHHGRLELLRYGENGCLHRYAKQHHFRLLLCVGGLLLVVAVHPRG